MKRSLNPILFVVPLAIGWCGTSKADVDPESVKVVVVEQGQLLCWQGQPGRTYFVQTSDPNEVPEDTLLQSWLWMSNIIEIGAGEPIQHQIDTTADKAFFRIWHTEESKPPGVTLEDWDADYDGLSNAVEISETVQTNPVDPDTDDDGLLDGFEVHNGLDPHDDGTGDINNGPQGDPDGDGWTNLQEQEAETNPKNCDTDGDGRADSEDPTPTQNDAIADPDSAGLDSSFNTGLIGRWDLESSVSGGGGLNQYANSSTPSWPATDGGTTALDADGMVSTGVRFDTNADYLRVDPDIVAGKTSLSISMWLRFEKNYLQNKVGTTNTVLFAFNDHLTAYPQFQLHAYKAVTPQGTQKLTFSHYANGILQPDVYAEIPIADPLDDGRWQHLVFSKNAGSIKIYRNGTQVSSINTPAGAWTVGPDGYLCFGKLGPVTSGADTAFRGSLDRLRCWSRGLSAAEALGLYHQDIDRDGLWDLTEQHSLLWRDGNGDGIRAADETDFTMNPYYWDDPDSDHDHDGLTSLAEQNVTFTNPAHPDSDGDRLSDGWEVLYDLDPLDPSDGGISTDTDGDGLSNLDEFMNGTNPNLADSDGDLVNDVPEIAQGSDPNDASDGGQAPAAEEILELRLGIGDESDSESEDYHLVCYEYESASFSEREVFRLVSGGHGQYQEKTSKIFRKWKTYTFKIEWQSSSLGTGAPGSGDGPDYDYTMKVEPVTPDPALIITDSFDPATGYPESGYQLLGQKSNVQNFEYISTSKRVETVLPYIDLAVDTNLNRSIESLPDGLPASAGWDQPNHSVKDRDLENATPPRPTVIDVNNNNTDSGTGAPTSGEVDNRSASLDTEADREEHTLSPDGHAFARLRIWANPTEIYGIPWYSSGPATHLLRLSLPVAGDDQILRIYSWNKYEDREEPEPDLPVVLLGPDKTSVNLDAAEFFGVGYFGPGTGKHEWKRDLFLEGLTYGTAKIRLELIEIATGQPFKADEVLVTVNVDRVEQAPADVPGKEDARHLRGFAPHYLGVRKSGLSYEAVRAVRGEIVARVPKTIDGSFWRSRHTPMLNHRLRQQSANAAQEPSGSSLWVGLKQTDPNGDFQWIQTGLRWVMQYDRDVGSYPAAYIESGDTHFSPTIAKSLHQASAGNGDQLGEGVIATSAVPLSTWDGFPVRLSFVMFKPSEFDENGQETTIEQPWYVIFRDERPGVTLGESSYIRLSVGKPVVQGGNLNSEQADELTERYRTQMLPDFDALFETNQTIAFAPGTVGEKATISNINVAPSLTAASNPPPNLESGSKEAIYNWALATFPWQPVTLASPNLISEIKSGRSLANGDAQQGTSPPPDWHAEVAGGALQIWDDRSPSFHENP